MLLMHQIILYVSERIYRKNIKSNHDNKTRDKKLQYDIKREAAKTSALSPGKTNQYKYFTGEKILLSNQR